MIHVNIGISMNALTSAPTPSPRRRYGGVLPEERQRLRRAKLIEGAIEVFGTKGFHAATVREVCVAAHLTERYFYESFKTLPQLFMATYGELRDQLMARTLAVLKEAEPTPLGMLEPAIRVFLEFIRDDPRRGRIMLVDDVITAGTAIRESMEIIQAQGAELAGVLIALDRQERGKGELSAIQEVERDYGMPVVSIVSLEQVLEYLAEDAELKQYLPAVQAYRAEYGI